MRHQPLEYAVERIEQRPTTAEVRLKIDDFAVPVRFDFEGGVSLEKQLRIGQTKSVDALLHIADAEEITRRFARNQRQDRVLKLVHTLIFIDQHMLELVSIRIGGH